MVISPSPQHTKYLVCEIKPEGGYIAFSLVFFDFSSC